jgi:hypothetical protein
MLSFLVHKNERREIRRRVKIPCRVVRESDRRLVGTNILDVSPGGMLVMTMRDCAPGDDLLVSFRASDLGIWFEARAKVARVVRGRRPKDLGRGIGITFTRLDPVAKLVLRGHLRRTAPPVPQREARIDYAATILRIALGD